MEKGRIEFDDPTFRHRDISTEAKIPFLSVNVRLADVVLVKAQIEEAMELVRQLQIALADAICSPKGVIPDSANGLVSQSQIDAAETRRSVRR